jgi:hypothetical protein
MLAPRGFPLVLCDRIRVTYESSKRPRPLADSFIKTEALANPSPPGNPTSPLLLDAVSRSLKSRGPPPKVTDPTDHSLDCRRWVVGTLSRSPISVVA